MGEQRIAVGTAGPVNCVCLDAGSKERGNKRPAVWRARGRVRLRSGELVQIERHKDTKKGAETALSAAISARLGEDLSRVESRSTITLGMSTAQWLEEVADDRRLSATSRQVYTSLAKKHILQSKIARRPITKLRPGDIEDLLRSIGRPGAAKTCRSVLSKIFARAVRRGEVERNIIRDIEPTGLPKPDRGKNTERALTDQEAWRLLNYAYQLPFGVRGTRDWRRRGTADLCAFMLSTALRVGEALAITRADIDFDQRQLVVRGTVTRIKGQGLQKTATKTRSSERVIPLHPRTLAQCKRLLADGREVLFQSRAGGFRDSSNTTKDIARLLSKVNLDWASSHTFRRTVLTRLGDRGVPLRLIADLAGHAAADMTARKYLGRRGPDQRLREAL